MSSVRDQLDEMEAMDVPEYKMPDVFPGEPILFQSEPSDPWTPAFVLKVGSTCISVATVNDQGAQAIMLTREGVRHERDPWLQDPKNTEMLWKNQLGGIFQLSPNRVLLETLCRHVEELKQRVRQLEATEAASG